MRTDEQLIQSALGDPEFTFEPGTKPEQKGFFNLYELALPDRFKRGLPPVWHFAVLIAGIKHGQKNISSEIQHNAKQIITSHPVEDSPLVFLSDYPEIRLDELLPNSSFRVFTLDHNELPGGERHNALAPRVTPIVFAARRRLDDKHWRMALCPYVGPYQALDWRFFGRRKELDKLVHSAGNFMVIGARKMGKTSLLRQVQRELEKKDQDVIFVDVQDCLDERQMTHAIMKEVSLRDFQSLERRNQLTDERFLELALKRLGTKKRMTIIIDEFGLLISRMRRDAWRVFGTLRKFSQTGKIRIIGAAFQEYFLRQQDDFEGPLVNFASTLRLTGFRDEEIDEFVLNPLQVWAETPNPLDVRKTILAAVGRHPLLLQYFGRAVFANVAQQKTVNLMAGISDVIGNQMADVFGEPVEEIYHRNSTPVLRYIFLSACLDAEVRQKPLNQMELDDDWLEALLRAAGYDSNTTARRNLLEGLELRGMTESVGGDHSVQIIVAPLIFRHQKKTVRGLEKLVLKYRREIEGERDNWGLTKLSAPELAQS